MHLYRAKKIPHTIKLFKFPMCTKDFKFLATIALLIVYETK